MSTGTAIKESDIIGKVARLCCHAIFYIGGFFFCVILPYHKGFSFAVISTLIFAALYTIACLTKSFISNRRIEKSAPAKASISSKMKNSKKPKKQTQAQTEYKSLFSDDN